ncbi:hypothetical protein LCGC14_1122920 [marine sediment metagenome]|uniref:DUF998 domain-containing protein n=1 Tax=marine sediment metagenome TaxID=412755 RepID=A0A0F9M878_9ZZZZ
MKKINSFLNKLYDRIPGCIFGLLTFIIGFLGDIIALVLSPDYVMWKKSVSILGNIEENPGGVFLRMGLIISNILAILFFIYLGRALKDENINENVRKIAVVSGIFTSVSAMLTGIFSGINEFISFLHGLFALFSWIGGITVCLLFGILMLKNLKFSKSIANFSLLIAGIFVFYLIPFFITNFCNLFPKSSAVFSFGRSIYQIMPVMEWIMIFSALVWYLINSIYLLKNRM